MDIALLRALSKLYGAVIRLRKDWRDGLGPSVPIVSIGNLTVGGNGKTPIVVFLARQAAAVKRVGIISRGYGRRGCGVRVVAKPGMLPISVELAGDEPTMVAEQVPEATVVVGRDRVAAAACAVEMGAELLIVDDGFQHRRLRRSVDIVAIDSERLFGNGELLPVGPLREPLAALNRADQIWMTRADRSTTFGGLRIANKPVVVTEMQPTTLLRVDGLSAQLDHLRDRRAVACCGIAHAEPFYTMLQQQVATLVATRTLPDHVRYGATDVAQIADWATAHQVELILVTHKDLVKLRPHWKQRDLHRRLELWAVIEELRVVTGEKAVSQLLSDVCGVKVGNCG